MIGCRDPACYDPHWFGHVTKPGYGEPEPIKPVFSYDPQENIDKCLDCPVKVGCNTKDKGCLLSKRDRGNRAQKIAERDEKVLRLIKSGWVNIDAICEELGISRNMYFSAKRRLREKGEI